MSQIKRQIKRRPLHIAAAEAGLSPELVIRFVFFRWIVPLELTADISIDLDKDAENLLLDDEDIARARLICELQQELGVNDESIPIILNLIDQLHRIRTEMENRLD